MVGTMDTQYHILWPPWALGLPAIDPATGQMPKLFELAHGPFEPDPAFVTHRGGPTFDMVAQAGGQGIRAHLPPGSCHRPARAAK